MDINNMALYWLMPVTSIVERRFGLPFCPISVTQALQNTLTTLRWLPIWLSPLFTILISFRSVVSYSPYREDVRPLCRMNWNARNRFTAILTLSGPCATDISNLVNIILFISETNDHVIRNRCSQMCVTFHDWDFPISWFETLEIGNVSIAWSEIWVAKCKSHLTTQLHSRDWNIYANLWN